MSFLENIIYGFISGIAEFLPVSSRAHQILLRHLFGVDTRDSIQNLLVHIGLLFSIYFACREYLSSLRRVMKETSATRRRRLHTPDVKTFYDLRLLKTGTFPLVVCLFLSFATSGMENSLLAIIGFLIFNAFVLFLAEHSSHGNRDSRTMTGLDGIVMGVLGALSSFPGISRTGMITAYATIRGADTQNATNWAFLLGIPALIFAVCFDVVGMITGGISGLSFSVFFGYLLSGAAAFAGGYLGISALRAILNHSGFSGFAYYSLGEALFSFILYLIT